MSKSRDQGTRWESTFVRWWNSHPNLPKVSRQDSPYSPLGDIQGLPGWVLELKDTARKEIDKHMTQAAASAERCNVTRYGVVYKKRRKPVGEAQIVIPLRVFASLIENQRQEGEAYGPGSEDKERVDSVLERKEEDRCRVA